MMNHFLTLGLATLLVFATFGNAQPIPVLNETFDLGRKHEPSPQLFVMESKLIVHALDGKRSGTEVYRLRLKCNPAQTGKEGDEYTCARFTWQAQSGAEANIPALANWAYIFRPAGNEKGETFGIDRSKFERLTDSTGKTLPPDKAYHVYNAFI